MQRFSRSGVHLPVTTLTGWVSSVCGLIAPLGEALTRQVLQSGYLQGDGWIALPANLEREVIEIAPEEDTSGLQKISEEPALKVV